MINVRRGVFETNSSSTHSITICTEDEYKDWEDGKVLLNEYWGSSKSEFAGKTFVTKEEAIDILKKSTYNSYATLDFEAMPENELEGYFFDENIRSKDMYDCDDRFEGYTESYTTPKGEKIVAFGEYGYDG